MQTRNRTGGLSSLNGNHFNNRADHVNAAHVVSHLGDERDAQPFALKRGVEAVHRIVGDAVFTADGPEAAFEIEVMNRAVDADRAVGDWSGR